MNPKLTVQASRLSSLYPILRQPGVYKPDARGRTMFAPNEILGLFLSKLDAVSVVAMADALSRESLEEALKDPIFKDVPRSTLINAHIDMGEALLLHHSKVLKDCYTECVNNLENRRGYYFLQQVEADDNDLVNFTEYAYYLIGRVDKMRKNPSTDAQSITDFNNDIETLLRRADQDGYIEATEALATFLYIEKENVEEAIALWERAAAAGHEMAIKNLSQVVMGDDSLTNEERSQSLTCIWQGIQSNRQNTRDTAKALKQAGYTMPAQELALG